MVKLLIPIIFYSYFCSAEPALPPKTVDIRPIDKAKNQLRSLFSLKTRIFPLYGDALFKAAKEGDLAQIKNLIENNEQIEARDDAGNTALIIATSADKPEIVSYLLEKGANTEAKDTDGQTALLIAASHNQSDIVGRLLDAGANVEAKSGWLTKWTSLNIAAEKGYDEIVQKLLEKNANKENKTDGKNALSWAVLRNHARIAKILLDRHANIEDQSLDSPPPLIRAIKSNNYEMVELLLRYRPYLGEYLGRTAMAWANYLSPNLRIMHAIRQASIKDRAKLSRDDIALLGTDSASSYEKEFQEYKSGEKND